MMHQRNKYETNLNGFSKLDIYANYHINKKLCIENNNINELQYHHDKHNAMNFISEDMQLLLDNTNYLNEEEIESHDSTYSAESSTSSLDNEYVDEWNEIKNDNNFVLGNIFTLEQQH